MVTRYGAVGEENNLIIERNVSLISYMKNVVR